jgi:hypothetical protein
MVRRIIYASMNETDIAVGGKWLPITPPVKDSLGSAYQCTGTVSEKISWREIDVDNLCRNVPYMYTAILSAKIPELPIPAQRQSASC